MNTQSNTLRPKYKLDERLQVHREVDMPPENMFIGLGWDETPEDNRKHYRRFYNDELEFVKDVMPVVTPFHEFIIKKGQTRGASAGLFSMFSAPKTDESGEVSTV
jgi:hypothetical protein